MKNFKVLMALLFGAYLLTFSACKDDKDDPKPAQGIVIPVYGEHFSVAVDGNKVTLACTMEAATSVIWKLNNKEYTQKTLTVDIPVKGIYSVVLEVSADGLTYLASEPHEFEVEESDLSFLNEGIWKALTGGPDNGKVWVLDLERKYFHAIADYYGDKEAGAEDKDAWGPWGGGYVSEYDLGGEISFNGATSEVTLKFNGETTKGIFSFVPQPRPASDDYIENATENKLDLWQTGFVDGPYKYLDLSDEIGTVQFPAGMHFPLDSARFYNDAAKGENNVHASQFLPADLEKCDIVHLSDYAMVVRVKRSYEGDKEAPCWMLYNFIVKGHEYEVKEDPTAPIDTEFDGASLVGTWKISPNQAAGWVDWETSDLFNVWETREAMLADLLSWWSFGDPNLESSITTKDDKNAAASLVTMTFEANKSCVIHNAFYDNETASAVESDYTTTYEVNEGIITFADEVKISAITIDLAGTEFHVINPGNGADEGLWIGHKNGDKFESALIQIVKQ